MLVEVSAELGAAKMVSLVRELGTVDESSTINSRLILDYPGVMRWTTFALAAFLVMEMVHCWAWRLGGGEPESAATAKKALASFGGGSGRIRTGGGALVGGELGGMGGPPEVEGVWRSGR